MTRSTTRATLAAAVLITSGLFCTTPFAADEPAAQNTTTVWVDGKGQSSVAEKMNKVHAEMEAKGWKFADMEIYTENGDMKGVFVTYVR